MANFFVCVKNEEKTQKFAYSYLKKVYTIFFKIGM